MRSMTQTAGVGDLVADDTAPVAVLDGMPTCVVDCSGTADLTAPPVADTERQPRCVRSPPSTRCSPPGRPARRRATLPHAALVNLLGWFDADGPGTGQVVLAKTPYTFDASA